MDEENKEPVMFRENFTYGLKDIQGVVKLTGGSCSHWLSPKVGSKGRKYVYKSHACYAPFIGFTAERKESLYIGLDEPTPITYPQGHGEYLDQIRRMLDIEGGYQRWFEWIAERSPHAPAIVQGQEWGYNRFVKMNVDAPSHLVHHAACVLRIHQEHKAVPLYWMTFTHAGMEEDLAYLMALMVRMDNKIYPSSLVTHAALSSTRIGCLAGFLLRGYYNEGIPTWRENSNYNGHGSMWCDGRGDKAADKHFNINVLFPKITAGGRGPFDPPPEGSYPLTVDGVKEFVEHAGVKVPRVLRVKLIDNPELTGVKYEKA